MVLNRPLNKSDFFLYRINIHMKQCTCTIVYSHTPDSIKKSKNGEWFKSLRIKLLLCFDILVVNCLAIVSAPEFGKTAPNKKL